MKRLILASLLVFGFAQVASADFTGKWKGSGVQSTAVGTKFVCDYDFTIEKTATSLVINPFRITFPDGSGWAPVEKLQVISNELYDEKGNKVGTISDSKITRKWTESGNPNHFLVWTITKVNESQIKFEEEVRSLEAPQDDNFFEGTLTK